MWNNNDEYLKTPSSGNLTISSWIASDKYWAKLNVKDGGCPGQKMDKEPSIEASTNSSVE